MLPIKSPPFSQYYSSFETFLPLKVSHQKPIPADLLSYSINHACGFTGTYR